MKNIRRNVRETKMFGIGKVLETSITNGNESRN